MLKKKEEEMEQRNKEKKRGGDGFGGVEENGYFGGWDLLPIMLDPHECFRFSSLAKEQTTQTTPLTM